MKIQRKKIQIDLFISKTYLDDPVLFKDMPKIIYGSDLSDDGINSLNSHRFLYDALFPQISRLEIRKISLIETTYEDAFSHLGILETPSFMLLKDEYEIRLYENFTTCGENYIGEKRIYTFDHALRFNKNELNFEIPNGITYLKSFIL